MKINVSVHIDVKGHVAKVDNNTFWTFAANEWWKLITPYVPMDTGTLSEQVNIAPKTIEYTAPYSGRVYNGTRINFRKDKHPLASAKWDLAAIPTQQDKLIRACQTYVNKIHF